MHRAWFVAFSLIAVAVAAPVFAAIPAAAQVPSITIVSPKVTTVSTLGLRVEVTVADFILDQANYGGPPIPGHGHIHYTVDGGALIATWLTIANIGGMSAGPHTIRAELVNNDHTPLSPAAFQEISVTAGAPAITILTPRFPTVSTLGLRMQVAVAGFFLDQPNYGGTPVPGQGHIHYTVDGGSLVATASPVADFGTLSAGAHTLRAELRQNNHAPLSPAVFAELSVTAAEPSIAILSPASTSVSLLGTRIVVRVQGFELDAENYAGTTIPGHGHIHYTVDGGGLIPTASSQVDIGPLSAGMHTIRAELRQNNHAPLSPAVFAEVIVTAGGPAISIVSPADTSVATLGFRIQVAVAGFILDAENYGGAPIPGRGHIHYTVDGGNLIATASPSADLAALSPGPHTIRAELRNNDHSALDPAVFAEIAVIAGAPRIRALEPTAGATVSALGFRVRVAIENFSFDMVNYGGTKIPGQGHYHVMLGTQLLGAPLTDSFVVTGLPAGLQTLNISLRNNDHSPIDPASFVSVTVTVAAPSIQATVSSTSVAAGSTVVVSWSVGGFVLDSAAIEGAPEAGRGHVHIFLDGTYVTATAGDTIAIPDLAAGSHSIKVQLFNNDHSALASEVSDEVTVQATAPPAPVATVDASLFYGSLVALLVVIGVLVALVVRKGRGGRPEPTKPENRE